MYSALKFIHLRGMVLWVWCGILLPIQIRQERLAREISQGRAVPEKYWKPGRLWLVWGVAATVPLVVSMRFMTSK